MDFKIKQIGMIPSSGRAVTTGKILRRKKIRFSEVTALPEEGSFSEGRNSASPWSRLCRKWQSARLSLQGDRHQLSDSVSEVKQGIKSLFLSRIDVITLLNVRKKRYLAGVICLEEQVIG